MESYIRTREKYIRNKELIFKRIQNPTRWSWAELGKFYRIKRHTARDIFERHADKFVHNL